jgi:isocitrate lyase
MVSRAGGKRFRLKPREGYCVLTRFSPAQKCSQKAKLTHGDTPPFNWTMKCVANVRRDEGGLQRCQRTQPRRTDEDEMQQHLNGEASRADPHLPGGFGQARRPSALPTYHTTALSPETLAKANFSERGMLGYVKILQREEIRQRSACVRHQNIAGPDIDDDHEASFPNEAALRAGDAPDTMNQFG